MAVDRDAFFAVLNTLTEEEIARRLPLFDTEQLSLVQEYADQEAIRQIKAALQGRFDSPQTAKTASAALQLANSANAKGTIALLFALGGWLVATVATLVYLAKG